MVVIFSQYFLNLVLQGYFFFVLPLAVLFFQPGNGVMGMIALALCLLERHILKEYWSRFNRFSIVFFFCQCVCYYVFFLLPVGYVIGHVLYIQCRPCLLPVGYLGFLEVGQIFVICNNLGPGL